ncbi:MAG: methyltransferase domain-containing protein [Candidatus Brocadia sp.]
MDKIAIFIEHYTICNSPSILNFIDFLSDYYNIDLFLKHVALTNTNILKKPNIRVINYLEKIPLDYIKERIKQTPLFYNHYVAFDPHGFVLCKELFPHSRPIYYSLELYMKDDHSSLHYPKEIMEKERTEIHCIKGLIIQSKEKERLFRNDYNLSEDIPSFILPITYRGVSTKEKSSEIREKYNIAAHTKIALHLGGIARWFSCIELAMTFSKIKNWVLLFHGYHDKIYVEELKHILTNHNIKNVIISEEAYDDINNINPIIMSCDLGIAWYNDISMGFRTAGKSSGKIPAYLKFGLPVIAKKYPSTIEAIEDTHCGICVDTFEEIADAITKIENNYDAYSRNACDEYDKTYRFENYKENLLDFFRQQTTPNYHFNWDKLLENKKVEDFLVSNELWGENQGTNNRGRITWLEYLKNKISERKIRLLEIGFGSGIDYKMLDRAGILDKSAIDYYGVDVTKKFVEYAHQYLPKMKSFLIDGYHLPFDDKYFDVVYLRHVLEHQIHYRPLLSEVFRVCRGEVFINFFIELSDSESDEIRFDGNWFHNTYSRKRFYSFAQECGFNPNELTVYRTEDKTDAIVICTRFNQNPETRFTPDSGKPSLLTLQNVSKFSPINRTYPEADKSMLSNFIITKLIPIVGTKPYPLDELLLICSAVSYFKPQAIIEWRTHSGCSARIFYETTKHLGVHAEIHSIDLPPSVSHPENLKDGRATFVKGLPITLHLGDGLDVAKELMKNKKNIFTLFFVDGDHSYQSVWRELNGIKTIAENAAILVHDTFYQGKESNYNCEPFEAVTKFAKENGYAVWSTQLGLPGMSLLWLNQNRCTSNMVTI